MYCILTEQVPGFFLLHCCHSFYSFPKTEEKPLVSYISMIHNKFLQEICNEPESGLKGLRYHGGPWVDCCKKFVLPCVEYLGNSNSNYSAKVYCEECYTQHDAEELLRLQVDHKTSLCSQAVWATRHGTKPM